MISKCEDAEWRSNYEHDKPKWNYEKINLEETKDRSIYKNAKLNKSNEVETLNHKNKTKRNETIDQSVSFPPLLIKETGSTRN